MFGLFSHKKEPTHNFAVIGADMHSHILPGIDDGAQNINDSLLLAKRFVDLGFKKIIATPHIMADYYRNTPATINKALSILQEALLKNNINLEIAAAAEYYLDEVFEKKLNQKDLLTFGNNYLLFELSYINPPQNLYRVIAKIQDLGYQPVLAHPERYAFYHGKIAHLQQIKEQGCYLQLNTISLTGYYGKNCQKAAEELIDNMLVDFIGSDMHHLRHADALKKTLYNQRLQAILAQKQILNLLL